MENLTKIVIASQNPGKLKEINRILDSYEIIPISEFDPQFDVIEDGQTYYDNALIKAKAAAELSGLPALSDDSGIEVDALEGKPGIFSARFSGNGDQSNNQKVLELLREKGLASPDQRRARFRAVIVFYDAKSPNPPLMAEGTIEGSIAMSPSGDGGFGYDPIFHPDLNELNGHFEPSTENRHPTLAEIPAEIKNKISHRAKALEKMKVLLENL